MGAIKVRDLSKRYGDFLALDSVSFEVSKGEIFGYLGPNGAGKTTTLLLLLGLFSPTGGEIKILDGSIEEHRKDIGAVLDSPCLYDSLSVSENLRFFGKIYGLSEVDKRIEELLDMLEIEDRKNSKVRELSKGTKQKVAIARALLHDPEILFFDEPTSGLDPDMQFIIRGYMKGLQKEGKTIFLNSHNLAEVQECCNRIAIIRKGRVIAIGSVDELGKKYAKRVVVKTDREGAEIIRKALSDMAFSAEGDTIIIENATVPEVMKKLVGLPVKEIKEEGSELEDLYRDIVRESERNE